MIKNKRDLANALSNNGKVHTENVSKKLNRIVNLWIYRKEIKIEGYFLIGCF